MSTPRFSLTAKFAIYSLLVIASIGLVIDFVLTNQIRAQLFDEYVTRALAIQRAVVSHHVKPSDFAPGSKRLAGPDFDHFVSKNMISKDLVFVRIVRRDSTVLYSNDRGTIGTRLTSKKDFEEALGGRIIYKEESHPADRAGAGPLLDMYSPIKFNGRTVGAFETYFSLQPLYARQRAMLLTVASLLAGGLGLLWLVLYGMVRNASIMIERQNVGLRRLSDSLSGSLDQTLKNYLGTMESLAQAVEARDPYTSGHSHRMEGLSSAIARQLKLSEEQAVRLDRAGELHDIGKIGIPEAILSKPETLTPEEWGIMKKHPVIGAEIISQIPFLKDVAPIVRHHHEHYDGSGYPDGWRGEAIPFEARALAVLDAFDTMISDRPYRHALPVEEALRRLMEASGTQFDPTVVEAFLTLYDRRPKLFRRLNAA
ncbi:MAG: HD domain-containing phosphohydrolase [Actinomycetota bacterium]|nr:HD domain-containing phosphohydrolase [Actinomycetota bacterium]